jgi:membrane protease YdiL (CAAX protease family)
VTPKPRVWTVFAAYALALHVIAIAGVVIFGVAAARALWSTGPNVDPDTKAMEELIEAVSMEPWVVLASATCSAFVLGGVALGAAKFSPTRLVERLRLGRARGDRRRFAVPPLTALAALGAGAAVTGALELVVGKRSEALASIDNAMRSSGPMLVLTFVIIAVTTPIGEELFFRGYAQTRLVERFGRTSGIAIATALFAVLHLDPMHVAGAFAIGAVLAWTTERTGSVWAAILAHAANNGLYVMSTQTTEPTTTWSGVAVAGLAGAAALAGIALLTPTSDKQQA